MATVELVRGPAEKVLAPRATASEAAPGPRSPRPRGELPAPSEPTAETATDDEVQGHERGRALMLLLAFLVGCALAAVVTAAALAGVWQQVYAWVLPQVVGDLLVG